jgi:glycosyltransferase involved in cell wall biosynthesis
LTGEKLINFYKACTVFVLPSIFRSEAFGIVLIEAMAAGKPVISTEVGTGTSFVNQNRVTGFVVSPKDSRALAQAIKKILGNKKLAQEFGQNALKRAREKFSLEKMLEEISRVYRDI